MQTWPLCYFLLFRQLLREHFTSPCLWVAGSKQQFDSTEKEHQQCHCPVSYQMMLHFHLRGGGMSCHPEGEHTTSRRGASSLSTARSIYNATPMVSIVCYLGLQRCGGAACGGGQKGVQVAACGLGAEA
mmetsp:Transcript_77697/g.155605  ORF Transcript_77697/g.155605 Transcript_77697/m.155605 type:complete len:129 (-) Transcript_77697:1251-1637(-)